MRSDSASLPRIRLARTPSASELDEAAPSLPGGIAELGALRQWGLADASKVAVRFDGRRPWGTDVRGDVGDVLAAVKAGEAPPRNVLGTYDEARAALLRLRGRPVPLKDWTTRERTDGPIVDGLSLRFLPVAGRRLVGVDFDGVIDERGRLHRACRWLLDELATFVEVSVSGRGLHAYVWVDDLDEALPDASTAYALGEGYGHFVPYPTKPPSVAIYDGRSWRHFRWSGVGYSRWAALPVANATSVVNRWLRDIAMCREVDAWNKAREVPQTVAPARRSGIAARVDWQSSLTVGEVVRSLGGHARGASGRFEAVCPRCRNAGRVSRDAKGNVVPLRPSLVIWNDGGRVCVHCFACAASGLGREAWEAVGDAVLRIGGAA